MIYFLLLASIVFLVLLRVAWPYLTNELGSITVDQAWIYRFDAQLNLTYQQKGSLLENSIAPGMVHRNVNGHIDHHERLGNVMANDIISPFGQTNILNPRHSRRACRLVPSDGAVLVNDINTMRMMVNPQNAYMETIVFALGRRADKHIIDALGGSAEVAAVTAGTGVITYTSQALVSANKIGTGVAIDLDLIVAAGVALSKRGVPSGANERIMLYSPGQLEDIMAITSASSSDFTKNRIHDTGTINGQQWQGFLWLEIADVVDEQPAATVLHRMLPLTSDNRYCYAFHRGAVGLSIGVDMKRFINERADLNNSIQVRALKDMGAVRVWDGGVMQLDVLENA